MASDYELFLASMWARYSEFKTLSSVLSAARWRASTHTHSRFDFSEIECDLNAAQDNLSQCLGLDDAGVELFAALMDQATAGTSGEFLGDWMAVVEEAYFQTVAVLEASPSRFPQPSTPIAVHPGLEPAEHVRSSR